MTRPRQYRMERIPPASSMSSRSLPANIVLPNSRSSGSTDRQDSNFQRSCSGASSSTSRMRSARRAKRSSRRARRSSAAAWSASSSTPRGVTACGTGSGLPCSSTFTKTRWEERVRARSPVAGFSA